MKISSLFATIALFASATSISQAQANQIWLDIDPKSAKSASVGINEFTHRSLAADHDALRTVLAAAPMEFNGDSEIHIVLPMPNGGKLRFRIFESPVISRELALQYPDAKTYKLYGVDELTASGRAGIVGGVFHALLNTASGTVFIDSASNGADNTYRSYYRLDYVKENRHRSGEFSCGLASTATSSPVAEYRQSLKTEGPRYDYDIAVAATGEYTAVVGGGNADTALNGPSGIVAAINRINQIYERDLNIHLNLVSGTSIVYTDGGTDPYTNSDGIAMLSENQANIDNVVGTLNYDIGHVFSTGASGFAGLGVVCSSERKAEGVTGISNPIGDPFWIDFVAHEIGHQLDANHTFNGTTGNCSGGNRNARTAFEPGSGSTIMAYAGICGSENLQQNSDDTFHAGSIEQIENYTGSVSCQSTTASANVAPSVDAGSDHTIPISTPFLLAGSGTDAESLQFQWDQMDAGTASHSGSIGTDFGDNALFRSFAPSANSNRMLPILGSILDGTNGSSDIGESLPTTRRVINFRLTARDGLGGVNSDDKVITVANTAGPFQITQPNSNVLLDTSRTQVVEWDVACTDLMPINCANVDILLSTNSGADDFSTTLAAMTPNDGSESVTLSAGPTANARIKVMCTDNTFFDISDTNFSLATGSGIALTAGGGGGNTPFENCGTNSEPNNSTSNATDITVPISFTGTVNDATDVHDTFKFDVPDPTNYRFILSNYGNAPNDLNLVLWRGIFNTVALTYHLAPSATKTIEFALSPHVPYYLTVQADNTQGSNQSYLLAIEEIGSVLQDTEPNDDVGQASEIDMPITFDGSIKGGTDPADVFRFVVAESSRYRFALETFGLDDGLEMTLLDSTGSGITRKMLTTDTDLSAGEVYYVRITAVHTVGRALPYTLTITDIGGGGGGSSSSSSSGGNSSSGGDDSSGGSPIDPLLALLLCGFLFFREQKSGG